MKNTNYKVEELFEDIVGKRFRTTNEIASFFKRGMYDEENLKIIIGDPQTAEFGGDPEGDDYMDCTLGKDICGKDYADFTLFFIKTNADDYYITEACWSY